MTKHDRLIVLCGAASLLALTAPAVAFAQTATALEEVVITARRTEERAQTVPIAVTPLSADVLKEQRITNFADLQYNVPGLSFSQANSRQSIRVQMRGQSQAFGSDFPGVDNLVAEVPVQIGGALPLYDLESVQVLKGPQGVAFGRNATGGAILVYPARPRADFSAYADLTLSNFEGRYYEGMVNIPLVADKLMVRAVGRIERREGTTLNLITGVKIDNQHTDNWRLSVLAKPTDWLENYTVIEGYALDIYGTGEKVTAVNPRGTAATLYRPPTWNGPTYLDEAALSRSLGRDKTRANANGFNKAAQLFLSNTTTFEINDHLRIKNVFGYQRRKSQVSNDQDGTALLIVQFGLPTGKAGVNQTYSNELQIQGETMEGRLRWLAGVFASQQTPVTIGDPVVSVVVQPFSALSAKGGYSKINSFAPFAQATVPLDFISQKLSLTVGARHTTDDRSSVNISVAPRSAANPGGAVITCGIERCSMVGGTPTYLIGNGQWKGWNYAITLDYKHSDNMLLYAAHRHGFKGGSFNTNSPNPAFQLVNPEYVDDVEIGVKSDWTLGSMRGRTNVALYHQWYKDIVQTFFDVATASSLNRNVAEATISGGELEATVIPAQGLEISGSYAYTKGQFQKSLSPIPIKRFPDVPEHRISLVARYDLPLDESLGVISIGGQATYTSSHYLNQNATYIPGVLPAYTLINLQADWRHIYGSNLDASVFVKNVADEEYFQGGAEIYDSIGFNAGIMGEPRTYGVQLRYTFGG